MHDKYQNLKDDDLMKNIFNLGKYKDKVGMKIPDRMITEAMKQTKHYRIYAKVFEIDVPVIQLPPTESTQGTHRIPSAPRSPTPKVDASAPTRSTVIRLRLPQRRSTRLTPLASVLTVDKVDELILQDTLQVSLAEHKSRQQQEARENVVLVEKHLVSEEIKKMVEGQEHVVDDNLILRNDEHNIPGTREKRKNVEEYRIIPSPIPIRSPKIYTDLVSSKTEKLQELTIPHTTSSSSSPRNKLSHINQLLSLFKAKLARFKHYKSFFQELQGRYGYLFEYLRAKFMPRKSFGTLANHLYDAMTESLPVMVDKHVKEQVEHQVPEQVRNQVPVYVAEGDQDDPHDDAHPEGDKSVKRQKTSEYETYVFRESSFGEDNEQEQGPSTSGNQEQADDYDFWTNSYASDDVEIPTKQVSQDIMEGLSLNVDEVNKCVKKFNPYARYGVGHWKNPHAKIFYIRKQNKPGKPKEVIYLNSKIVQVIKTYWELGHEHKFITEIIERRANDCIVSTTEPDFKNLNKNDIEDMYLLIMNGNVSDYAETGLLWFLSVFIRSSVI
nr:hypothetical protein [Tanacetum cinerariifolium]